MSSGIPRTLNECFMALQGLLGEEGVGEIRELCEADLPKLHHGLGRRIRNAWGLWEESELKLHLKGLGLSHPDDMSAVILTAFWRSLHGLPLGVEDMVKHYQEYWHRQKGAKTA